MALKAQLGKESVEFRSAKPSDAKIASRLLFETFPRTATFMIGLGSDSRAKAILEKIFIQPGHRLSYEFTEVVVHEGRVIGLFTGFPGKLLPKLDRRLGSLLLHQYRLRGKFALVLRSFPLVFIKEVKAGEYFLSNLAVKRQVRGQGVGAKILDHVEEAAHQAGLAKASLMVNIDNKDARRFYERHGYKIESMHLESNKRVPHLGLGYIRMVKIIDEN